MKQTTKSGLSRCVLLCSLYLLSSPVQASEIQTVEQAFLKCKNSYPSEFEAKKRLACFDSINPVKVDQAVQETITSNVPESSDDSKVIASVQPNPENHFLERKWRLTSEGDWDITDFETYKSNYLLFASTNDTNDIPFSPNHPTSTDRNLNNKDLKFQFSLKTELFSNIPLIRNLPYVTSSRLWAAYTQQSYWQTFNPGKSRPLRDNDYEPELILSLGIDNAVNGVKRTYIPRMLNMGLVHQSNGQSDPLSRSWNRLYLQGGWELSKQLTLMVRPWWRIPENDRKDDNPDISKYMGYGDVSLRWENETHKTAASVLLRNNMRADNKGFVQLDLQRQVFPDRNINLHFMLSSGYGESLLDYNHSQSVIGVGLSLGE